MSWSVRFIGTPEKVVEALDKFGDTLSGQSKEEFDEAKPALVTLVNGNVGPMVDLNASGHASFAAGKKVSGNTSVVLSPVYGSFVG